jgi:hypothetical protein
MLAAVIAVMGAFAQAQKARADKSATSYELEFIRYRSLILETTPIIQRRSKCDSCGSREFKEHHGQTVCSYCRSGA